MRYLRNIDNNDMYLITITTSRGLTAQFKSQEARSEREALTSNVSREWIQDIKDWYIERSLYALFGFTISIDEVCGSTIKNVEWWSVGGLRKLYDENNKGNKKELLNKFKLN